MISTLHGRLSLAIFPNPDADLSPRGRMQICRVRGSAFGQEHVNIEVTLDTDTGEILLMSPDNFVGSFRMGDLVAAQLSQMVARAQREREEEGSHVAPTH